MKSVKRILFVAAVAVLSFAGVNAQEEEATGLEIAGSVDTYFKYDFSGVGNSTTSFAGDQNSVSLGMIDLGLSQSVGKASFVGELSFGPRSQNSLPVYTNDDGSYNVNIQNLFASYQFTDAFSATAGYMGTFVGYELISPAGNFNYSTSYLFTNGPFQNAGLRLDYSFSDKFAVMAGMFNDWNVYTDENGISDFGAQVYVAPVEDLDIYVNFVMGPTSGTIIDLTAGYQITDDFYLGLNAADYTYADSDLGGYTGFALYPQYAFSDKVSLGYRGEYFIMKESKVGEAVTASENVFSNTLTLNYYAGPMTFSTEFRSDAGSSEMFMDGSGDDAKGTKSFSQILFAAIYTF